MKTLIINLLLMVFTTQQAIAYAPSVEQIELHAALNEISKSEKLPTIGQFSSGKKMNFKQYKKQKRKLIRKINKRVKKLYKLTPASQVNHLVNQKMKEIKKVRRVAKKISKKRSVMRAIAKNKGISSDQAKSLLSSKSTQLNASDIRIEIEEIIREYGSYITYLKELRSNLYELTYATYKSASADKSNKSISNDDDLFVGLLGFAGIGIAFVLFWAWVIAIILGFSAMPILIGAGIAGGIGGLLVLAAGGA
jgi:hypothetical protein